VDYASGGQPKAATSSSPVTGSAGGSGQITVQVQAMDSQSFLDHSDDIAQAVRQAMLQSSVLNDVIREV
jgi:gamma-glutamyltranspeptidase